MFDSLLFFQRLDEFSGGGHTRTHFAQESSDVLWISHGGICIGVLVDSCTLPRHNTFHSDDNLIDAAGQRQFKIFECEQEKISQRFSRPPLSKESVVHGIRYIRAQCVSSCEATANAVGMYSLTLDGHKKDGVGTCRGADFMRF